MVKYCALLKNRSDDQHVCSLRLKDIKRDIVPKRSNRSIFKFANFPKYLITNLKKVCHIKKSEISIDVEFKKITRDKLCSSIG